MRRISLIVTIFMCFMIVHPVVKTICNFSKNTTVQVCSNNCCFIAKKTCYKSNKQSKPEKPCCPSGLCNPFENCPLCHVALSEKLIYPIYISEVEEKTYYSYNEFAKSEYLFSLFHPPEFAGKIA